MILFRYFVENEVDLIDLAATKVYLQDGKVYILQQEEMPEDTSIFAIFRYP